ncbi:MAG: hypothetical protein GKR89_00155 [Candidatus Latescibacteria bacterium]|nr:hypothetical protein [Candidatus Latescibacterota bacterium]
MIDQSVALTAAELFPQCSHAVGPGRLALYQAPFILKGSRTGKSEETREKPFDLGPIGHLRFGQTQFSQQRRDLLAVHESKLVRSLGWNFKGQPSKGRPRFSIISYHRPDRP